MDKIVEILERWVDTASTDTLMKWCGITYDQTTEEIAAEIRAEIEKEYKEKGFTTATFSEKDGLVFNKD